MRRTSEPKPSKNTTVIPVGYVEPSAISKTQLGEGIYSLNKRSNVPFVTFVGSAGFKKTISWGEICEVGCGQLVTVQNASYHGGDIFINKGPDMCNRPSRISVPVQFEQIVITLGEGDINAYTGAYPCDTRGAKRAYLNIDAYVKPSYGDVLTAFVRGRKLDGSMKTANSLQEFARPYGPGVGFLSAQQFNLSDQLTYIPLGQGAAQGDDTRPHMLLDAHDVFFDFQSANLANVMVWPADSDLTDFPAGTADGPGCWYIVEYD